MSDTTDDRGEPAVPSRRKFIRGAAVLGAGLALGACRPGTNQGVRTGTTATTAKPGAAAGRRQLGGTLRIIQWSHFVPAYDTWFDGTYTKQWGERNGVQVVVDHIAFSELPARAAAEVAAQAGHDMFWFLSPPPAYEDQVIDHREVVEEVQSKLGKPIPLAERSTYNPKTKKWFGFADNWVPDPVHYRTDLWDRVEPGLKPDSWEDVLKAGPKLKAMGHPLGIGYSQDIDANMALMALMNSFGSYVQDENARVTINSKETVEAVKMGAAIFKAGMTDEVFAWNAASNNQFLLDGKGSMILNAISALRTAEKQKPELARNIGLAPVPRGPVQRLGMEHVMGVYVIWKFAQNQEAAKQFLVDLALNYREAFVNSQYYNFPAFPGAVKDLKELVTQDAKVAVLADAESWSTNVGHPGYANAAMDQVFNQFLIPQMFAQAARGAMRPEEAVRAAESQIKLIFEQWRQRGKI